MASRTSSRGRTSARSRSSSSTNMQPFVIGGVGLAVVVGLVFVMSNSGSGDTKKNPENVAVEKTAAKAATPAAAPVKMEAAKAGGSPKRPAPALTEAVLQQARDLLASAKSFCNEGITARNAGDNGKARERQALAKDKIDALKKLVEAASLWQEEAQMENWAQPAEYMTLEKLLGELGPLEKRVRMGGGM